MMVAANEARASLQRVLKAVLAKYRKPLVEDKTA